MANDDLEKGGNRWRGNRRKILLLLKKEPKSHWLLTRLGTTYWQEGKNDLATKYIKQALKIQPSCPLALWDYGSALSSARRERAALGVFRKIIRINVRRIAFDDCGEGMRWAKSLVNDSRYRAAASSHSLGLKKESRSYFRQHFANRAPGIPSLYTRRYVMAKCLEAFPDFKIN